MFYYLLLKLFFQTANFPKEFVPVIVKPELVKGPSFKIPGYDTTPSLLSVFRCYFEDISNGTYIYDVFWYINGNNVTSKLNVPFENIDSTLLRDTDWIGLYTMNMEVIFLSTVLWNEIYIKTFFYKLMMFLNIKVVFKNEKSRKKETNNLPQNLRTKLMS